MMNLFKLYHRCFILAFFVFNAKWTTGQIVKQQMIVGGGEQIGWYWDQDQAEFSLYVQRHINGELWDVGEKTFDNFLKGYREKNKAGRLLKDLLVNNSAYIPHVFVKIRKVVMDDDLKIKHQSSHLFHSSTITTDSILHIAKFSGGIGSLDSRGVDGLIGGSEQKVHSNISDFSNVFPQLQHIGDTVSSVMSINLEGEGLFGARNMQNWLSHTVTRCEYDQNSRGQINGFKIRAVQNKIVSLNNIEQLKNCTYIDQSLNYRGQQTTPFWLQANQTNKKDRRNYRLATVECNGNVVHTVDYTNEFSRRPIILNNAVYGENGKIEGFVSVFGYDHKAPKDIQGEQVTAFDIIYLDSVGNWKWKTTINNGNEKYYKDAIVPLRCYSRNGKLVLLNYRQESFFKAVFEVLAIDEKGNKELLLDGSKGVVFGNDSPIDFIEKADELREVKGDYWSIKAKEDLILGTSVPSKVYSQIFVTMMDGADFRPKVKKMFTVSSTRNKPTFTLLDDQDSELKYLVGSDANYYMLTLNKEKGPRLFQ